VPILHALVATEPQGGLPGGGAETVIWVVLGAVLVGLYLLIRRTRRRSERAFMDARRREDQLRANDPDLRRPDDP